MIKERIKEVLEFTKSESPYRKANKGWINEDIFLDLSPYADSVKETNEDAKVTLFWSPINRLLSNIFLIIIVGSILVFTSVSFAKGRFDLNFLSNSTNIDVIEVEENKDIDISQLNNMDFTNSKIQKNPDPKDLDKLNEMNSLDEDLIKSDQKIINKKIDKQDSSKNQSQSNKDTKIIRNKKPKSNFI